MPCGEEVFDLLPHFHVGEGGAAGGCAGVFFHPAQDGIDVGRKKDHETIFSEVVAITGVHYGSPSGCDYEICPGTCLGCYVGFEGSEGGFAVLRENARYGFTGSFLDCFVGVLEFETELFGQGRSNKSLAGTSESYKGYVAFHNELLFRVRCLTCSAVPFSCFPATNLAGFFIDRGSFYLSHETFILALFLEAPEHFVQGLIAPGLNLYH